MRSSLSNDTIVTINNYVYGLLRDKCNIAKVN